jgi:putative FmdB family regulatory protein
MPIYEYECDKCRCRFEKRQRFYDEAVACCPKCEGNCHRVFSVGAVIYKGSGFYVTDTRKEKDIENIGKPDKETAEKYPQFSGLDKK